MRNHHAVEWREAVGQLNFLTSASDYRQRMVKSACPRRHSPKNKNIFPVHFKTLFLLNKYRLETYNPYSLQIAYVKHPLKDFSLSW